MVTRGFARSEKQVQRTRGGWSREVGHGRAMDMSKD
jgi:hypothetical protein